MKLRIAKKILSCQWPISRGQERKPPAFGGNYSGQQKLLASIRLFRYASLHKNGELAFKALHLRPIDSFQPDDQVDLKFERLIGQYGRCETLTVSKDQFIPPPPDNTKPGYRKDGQIGNPNALPYPGKHDKVTFVPVEFKPIPADGEVYSGTLYSQHIKYSKIKNRSHQTALRYQARDNNNRKVPKYHV